MNEWGVSVVKGCVLGKWIHINSSYQHFVVRTI